MLYNMTTSDVLCTHGLSVKLKFRLSDIRDYAWISAIVEIMLESSEF